MTPTARVSAEWLRRVEAEYRSAALTHHLVLWLIQIGASPDLIRDGLRIVDDELAHAELCRAVQLAAGDARAPLLDREALALPRTCARLEDDVALAVARVFCLGETVAVPLFENLRRGATVAPARAALDRILVDEVRHREFGWTALEWLAGRPDGRARELVTHALPGWLAELEASYGDALEGGLADLGDGERAWGLAPASEYAALLHRSLERDHRPRFARLGVALPVETRRESPARP